MTKQRLPRLSTRLAAALIAAAAAIGTTAVLATSGSAQAPPSSLRFVTKSQQGIGFFPKARPHQGDRFGFGSTVTGDDTGISRGVCTVIGKSGPVALCTIQMRLAKGTLSAQALLPQRSNNTPVAITGGTGAYNGARGTALATDVNQTTTNITVTLLP
jgi:hypothetical protein